MYIAIGYLFASRSIRTASRATLLSNVLNVRTASTWLMETAPDYLLACHRQAATYATAVTVTQLSTHMVTQQAAVIETRTN